MVVMDWSMKFLPLLFREKQSDWFGQKGLNWHVTVCVLKDYENQLKVRFCVSYIYFHFYYTSDYNVTSLVCVIIVSISLCTS